MVPVGKTKHKTTKITKNSFKVILTKRDHKNRKGKNIYIKDSFDPCFVVRGN